MFEHDIERNKIISSSELQQSSNSKHLFCKRQVKHILRLALLTISLSGKVIINSLAIIQLWLDLTNTKIKFMNSLSNE